MVNDPPHLIFVPVGIVFARDHQVSLTFSDGDPRATLSRTLGGLLDLPVTQDAVALWISALAPDSLESRTKNRMRCLPVLLRIPCISKCSKPKPLSHSINLTPHVREPSDGRGSMYTKVSLDFRPR